MPVQMELSRIIISEINDQQVIYLREVDGPRMFPILIGIFDDEPKPDPQEAVRGTHGRPALGPRRRRLALRAFSAEVDASVRRLSTSARSPAAR